eukprot:COSAG05_NODE_807_length_7192_cov_92.394191_9_plen_221_part_00
MRNEGSDPPMSSLSAEERLRQLEKRMSGSPLLPSPGLASAAASFGVSKVRPTLSATPPAPSLLPRSPSCPTTRPPQGACPAGRGAVLAPRGETVLVTSVATAAGRELLRRLRHRLAARRGAHRPVRRPGQHRQQPQALHCQLVAAAGPQPPASVRDARVVRRQQPLASHAHCQEAAAGRRRRRRGPGERRQVRTGAGPRRLRRRAGHAHALLLARTAAGG